MVMTMMMMMTKRAISTCSSFPFIPPDFILDFLIGTIGRFAQLGNSNGSLDFSVVGWVLGGGFLTAGYQASQGLYSCSIQIMRCVALRCVGVVGDLGLKKNIWDVTIYDRNGGGRRCA
jgi:hypothetical protein